MGNAAENRQNYRDLMLFIERRIGLNNSQHPQSPRINPNHRYVIRSKTALSKICIFAINRHKGLVGANPKRPLNISSVTEVKLFGSFNTFQAIHWNFMATIATSISMPGAI